MLAQTEFCLHVDRDPTRRGIASAAPGSSAAARRDQQKRAFSHSWRPGSRGAAHRRQGACAAQELDRALDIVDKMALPANWAFEGYANLPEVALALWEHKVRRAPHGDDLEQMAKRACTILNKFARAHRFARPRALIYAGICHWQHGRRRKAFSLWQRSAAAAAAAGMSYDLGAPISRSGATLRQAQVWRLERCTTSRARARSFPGDWGRLYALPTCRPWAAPVTAGTHVVIAHSDQQCRRIRLWPASQFHCRWLPLLTWRISLLRSSPTGPG